MSNWTDAFDIEMQIIKDQVHLHVNARSVGDGRRYFKTAEARTYFKEHNIKVGRPLQKATVHNGHESCLKGTWVFELASDDRPKPKKTRTTRAPRKKKGFVDPKPPREK